MSWESPFQAVGVEPFVTNLLALVEAHQADALAWAGRDQTLEVIQVFNNSARINQKWPALTIAPRTEGTPSSESGQYLNEVFEIVATIEIVFADPTDANAIGRRLMRYARAVRAMI